MIGAQRAADLVPKMLAYAGEGRVISELVDLDELIREMLDLLQASAARHCTLEYTEAGPLPRIRVDPTQLRQVVLNLIVNASEAVEDSGRITVSGGSEVLTATALADMTFSADATPGRFAYIEVRDNGTGDGLGDDDAHLRSVLLDQADRPRIGTGGGAGDRQEPQRRAAGARARPAAAPRSAIWFPLEPEVVLHAGV